MSRKLTSFLHARNAPAGVALSWYLGTPAFLQVERGELDPEALVFHVLRSECTDLVWGSDYAEHFEGLHPAGAEEIYRGPLPPLNRRKYEYLDTAVQPWRTYAYWIGSEHAPAAGPAAVRRVDTDAWWPLRRIEAEMQALAAGHPGLCRPRRCGTSCLGSALTALGLGNPTRPVVLVGATHAGESGPELILGTLARLLARDATLLQRVGVVALPVVNVDARERLLAGAPWYGRTSVSGVDLNRNFPAAWEEVDYSYGLVSSDPDAMTYRGPAPASEPETRALIALLQAAPPAAVFSYHCLGSITGAGFLTAGAAAGDTAYLEQARRLATAYRDGFAGVAPAMPAVEPAAVHTACTAGSLPAWVYEQYQVPCFDLEKASDHPAEVAAVTCSMTPQMLAEYQERHYRGVRGVLELLAEES